MCFGGTAVPTTAAADCGPDGRGSNRSLSVYETAAYVVPARTAALIGCVAFDPAASPFSTTLGKFPTVFECAKQAIRNGFDVFGVHSHGTCVGGKLAVTMSAAGACPPTIDAFGYNLGDATSIAVYTTETVLREMKAAPTPTNPELQTMLMGCYEMDPTDPPFFQNLGRFATVVECAARAAATGFEVFGAHANGNCLVQPRSSQSTARMFSAPATCGGAVDQYGFPLGGPQSVAVYKTAAVVRQFGGGQDPFRSSDAVPPPQ